MKFCIRIAGILAFALIASGQRPQGVGIVYGLDHAFAIGAPKGWVLDNRAGTAQGLQAVFYEEGKTWQGADVVMYVNAANKEEGQRTLEELMAFDAGQFKRRAPRLSLTSAPALATSTGAAVVRHFAGDEHGNFEAVAYIDEECTIIMLVLTSRTKSDFERAYPAFEDLVLSYRFLTSDVRTR